MSSQLLVFNGIDVDSGEYLLPPMQPGEFAELVVGIPRDDETRARVNQYKAWLAGRQQDHLGVVAGVDPQDLAQTGWGVIFPAGADPTIPAIREALSPLLEHRRKQATRNGDYYREYTNDKGFRPDDKAATWLARQGASAGGPANPSKVPYYLLIVGDPQTIPYRFQYELDVQYAVGRIYFDTLAEYDQYARSVVAAETATPGESPRAVFFGVQNHDDHATNLSANELVKPLADALDKEQAKWKKTPRWTLEAVLGEDARKERLGRLLGGDQTPRLLFTAGHGLGGFEPGDPRQMRQQGALVCQDWPGPQDGKGRGVSPDWFFAGEDISDAARVGGLMAFHFACYGAGTPQMDDFSQQAFRQRSEIAPRAFVAALPRRLLGHPRGGALAVVGHVERAWGYSFLDQGDGAGLVRQIDAFQSALAQLMQGCPVGMAMEFFNERFATLSVGLNGELEDISYGKQVDDMVIANMWTANNDARNFVVLGDPAARINLAGKPSARTKLIGERMTITPSTLSATAITGDGQATNQTVAGQVGTPDTLATPTPQLSQAELNALVAENFGLFDGASSAFQEVRQRLAATLQQLAEKLGETIQHAASDLSALEVATYVSDNMADVGYDNGKFTGPVKLRALTRINLDGDSVVCVPETDGHVDDAVWAIHLDMVQRAQAHKLELLKSAASAVAGLLDALKSL